VLCSACKKELDSSSFYFRDKKKGTLKKICKNCHSTYRKKHYEKNKQKYIEKAKRWNEKQGVILREYIYQKLIQSVCVDCGEDDISVLEFDHIQEKRFSITQMYRDRYSLEALKGEIGRCVVRCANCHRRKTANQFGFWKLKMSKK
jgi:superfamily II DNA helicase RecQ